MKRPPWIIAASVVGLLGLGGLLLWQWRAVGAPPPPAAELLTRALAAETSVDYTGVLHTVTSYQGQRVASTVRVYRQAPNRERMEYGSAKLAGLVTGCNEHGCWQYDPTLARTIRSGPFRSAAPGPRREDLIRRNYVIDCTGTDRVAGRPAYVLSLTPQHPGNPSRRLWVDQATFVVLRREDYAADGALRTQTTFREINYRPRLAANLFDAPADPSHQVAAPGPAAPMTLKQVSAEVGFTVVQPPYLPPGYEYASGQVYRCPCGCGMISAQLQYVDGLNCLTVFETGAQHAGCSSSGGCAGMMRNGEPPCLLADYGYARFASVVTTDPTFTAVGDLAREELTRVVEGLRRQKNGKSKTPTASRSDRTRGDPSARVCEMCRKPLVAGREVVVTDLATQQRHFYRCVHCAMVAMSQQFPQARAELTSAVQRRPITLFRDGDQWRSQPDTAVLLILPEENGECIARHQTFADPEEFQAYLRDHPDLAAQKPQSHDLSDVDSLIRAGYAGGP